MEDRDKQFCKLKREREREGVISKQTEKLEKRDDR